MFKVFYTAEPCVMTKFTIAVDFMKSTSITENMDYNLLSFIVKIRIFVTAIVQIFVTVTVRIIGHRARFSINLPVLSLHPPDANYGKGQNEQNKNTF